RPGEKLYEELLIDTTKATETLHPRIFCAQEPHLAWSELTSQLEKLLLSSQTHSKEEVLTMVRQLVPEYHPPKAKLVQSVNVSNTKTG
ncbi:MAG: polysaccharide biosynthesis protein, partial [Microcystaceae cyanobacterium]